MCSFGEQSVCSDSPLHSHRSRVLAILLRMSPIRTCTRFAVVAAIFLVTTTSSTFCSPQWIASNITRLEVQHLSRTLADCVCEQEACGCTNSTTKPTNCVRVGPLPRLTHHLAGRQLLHELLLPSGLEARRHARAQLFLGVAILADPVEVCSRLYASIVERAVFILCCSHRRVAVRELRAFQPGVHAAHRRHPGFVSAPRSRAAY